MVLYARDIVEKDFITLEGDTSIIDAAKTMNERKHGFVIVSSPTQYHAGIVTEWDILSKVVAGGKDPEHTTLWEIMTPGLVTVKAEDGIGTVAQVMSEKGIRRVLVMDGDKVLGVITAKTLLARLKEYVDKVSTQIGRLQAPWF
jgi:CBS domain-containing protein